MLLSSVTNGHPSIILVGSVAGASRFIEVHMGFRWVFCNEGLILISVFFISLMCCMCNFLPSVAMMLQGFILYLSKIHVGLMFDKALNIIVPMYISRQDGSVMNWERWRMDRGGKGDNSYMD